MKTARPKTDAEIIYFLMDRIKVSPSGCFEWQGRLSVCGYGVVGHKGWISQFAHRVSFHVFRKSLTGDKRYVCHKCDNPRCINPAHLFLGTQAQNIADCVAKGRSARGERNGNARLTEQCVREIMRMYADGEPVPAIMERFSIAYVTAMEIVGKRSWKHLDTAKVPARSKGRCQKGFLNNHTVLNPEMVREIKALHESGLSERAIAKKLGISRSPVSNVLTKKSFESTV